MRGRARRGVVRPSWGTRIGALAGRPALDPTRRSITERACRGLGLVSAAAGVMPSGGSIGDDHTSGEDSDGDCGDGDDADAKRGLGPSRSDVRRWRDQERRNEGVREELARQRAAFKVRGAGCIGKCD
jgi:hypothetical protein